MYGAPMSMDMARCQGNGEALCEDCRRNSPGDVWTPHMVPPVRGEVCVYYKPRIEPCDEQGRGD